MENPYAAPASPAEVEKPPRRPDPQPWKARLLFWPVGGYWLLNGLGGLAMFFAGSDRMLGQLSTTALLLMVIEAGFLVYLGGTLVYAGVIAVSSTERAGSLAQGAAWASAARLAFTFLGSALALRGTGSTAQDNGVGFLVGTFFALGLAGAIHSTGAWLLGQAERGGKQPQESATTTVSP